MTDRTSELSTAVYGRLAADAGILAIVSDRIYDHPTHDPIFPYIQIGMTDRLKFEGSLISGSDIEMQIICWDRNEGRKQVQALAKAVFDLLDEASFVVTSTNLVNAEHIRTNYRTDVDGHTQMGEMFFRFVTQE